MKVFISWSGAAEKKVAEAMRAALKTVCAGRAEVFVSSQDIPKGARGANAIGESLSSSDYGIVLVSAQNQEKPWINYEAGALAKSLDAPVSTVLLDLIPSDVTGPLASFQATVFTSEDDMRELFTQIAAAADPGLPLATVSILLDSSWPAVRDAWTPSSSDEQTDEPRRPDGDMLAELVDRIRRMEAGQQRVARDGARALKVRDRQRHADPDELPWFDRIADAFAQSHVPLEGTSDLGNRRREIQVGEGVVSLPSWLVKRLEDFAEVTDHFYRISGPSMSDIILGPNVEK
jgi:hypothetical protein